MKTHNHTGKTIEEIRNMPLVGMIHNRWRGRSVELYAPKSDDMLYMIGVSFDGQTTVISYEPIGLNERRAMDYWKHGNKPLITD